MRKQTRAIHTTTIILNAIHRCRRSWHITTASMCLALLAAGASAANTGASTLRAPIVAAHALTSDARVLVTQEQVWRTPDRGASWVEVTPQSAAYRFVAADFSRDGIANLVAIDETANQFRHLRSVDGGASWVVRGSVPSTVVGKQHSLSFTDATHGWLLVQEGSTANFSYGQLFGTVDGGHSWQQMAAPPVAGRILFKNAQQGVLIGGAARNQAFVTNDAGATWLPSALPHFAVEAGVSTLQVPVLDANGDITTTAIQQFAGQRVEQRYVLRDNGQWRLLVPRRSTAREDAFATEASVDANTLTVMNNDVFERIDGGMRAMALPSALREADAQLKAAVQTTSRGFDSCEAPTVAQMQNWKTNSPYGWSIIYLGGSQRACPQNNLNSSWVSQVFAQGWRVVPTWVGPQSPTTSCAGCGDRFSTNSTTARQQGRDQAVLAANAAANISLPVPSIIYYDLERYNTHTAAEEQFVIGWTEELAARGYKSGLYADDEFIPRYDALAIKPDSVWIARWYATRPSTLPSADVIPGLANTVFAGKRLWQYLGDVNVTYGGLTIAIDENVSNGLTTAPGTPPAIPTGLTPGGTASPGPTLTTLAPVLSWTAVSGATQYGVAVRDLSTNTLIVDTTVTGTSYTASIVAGRAYRWNVNACNSSGCSSYPSAVYFTAPSAVNGVCGSANGAILDVKPTTNLCSAGVASAVSGTGGWTWTCGGQFGGTNASCSAQFSGNVAPSIPTNMAPGSATSPGPTLGSKTVKFAWAAMPRAAKYNIAVRDMSTNVLVVDTVVTTNTHTVTFTGNRPYRWNVNACTVNNVCSDYSGRLYFKTPN